MSENKNKKGNTNSKKVQPTEEKIEKELINIELTEAPKIELTEEVIEVKPIDSEVFETKLFVEEEPEEFIFSAPVPDELGELLEFPVEEPAIEVPTAVGLEYAEDFKPEDHPNAITLESHAESCVCVEPCICVAPTLEEQPNQGCIDTPVMEVPMTEEEIKDYIESYPLTPEPKKVRTLESLSGAELKHFRRTGQMPK